MGSGGTGAAGGSNSGPIGSSGPRAGLGSPGAQGQVGNYSGTPGGGGGGLYAPQANTPEMRTYKDPYGNTVKVYQTTYGGGLNEAHGYKEVYSPTGKLISTTKPRAAANSPPPPVNPYRTSEVK